jgi:hypothetical protein
MFICLDGLRKPFGFIALQTDSEFTLKSTRSRPETGA